MFTAPAAGGEVRLKKRFIVLEAISAFLNLFLIEQIVRERDVALRRLIVRRPTAFIFRRNE
jgi:hypothetical protein